MHFRTMRVELCNLLSGLPKDSTFRTPSCAKVLSELGRKTCILRVCERKDFTDDLHTDSLPNAVSAHFVYAGVFPAVIFLLTLRTPALF